MIDFVPHLLVIDASVAIELLLRRSAYAETIAERVFAAGASLHAPHLLDLEVIRVLRRYERAGQLSRTRGEEVIADLWDLGIHRHGHNLFAGRIWELRHNVTAYDAAYLSLAETLDAEFLTMDVSLGNVPGCEAVVTIMG